MEDIYDIQLQLQNLQHELEFVKRIRNVEVTRREYLEGQLRKLRQELEQSKSERSVLQEQLHESQQQAQELDTELLRRKQKCMTAEDHESDTGNQVESCEENQESSSDDDSDIEILEILPKPAENLTGVTTTSSRNEIVSKRICGSRPGNTASKAAFLFDDLWRKHFLSPAPACSVSEPTNAQTSDPDTPMVSKSSSQSPVKIQQKECDQNDVSASAFYIVEIDIHGKKSKQGKPPNKQNTCTYCGTELRSACLKSHIRKVHRHPNTSSWRCSHCSKQYSNGDGLKYHYYADHCNIRYACGMCDILFKCPASVKRHRKFFHDS